LNQWKELLQKERSKNEHLREQLFRKDKELRKMFQMKFQPGGGVGAGRGENNAIIRQIGGKGYQDDKTQQSQTSQSQNAPSAQFINNQGQNPRQSQSANRSPQEILQQHHGGSNTVEGNRSRNSSKDKRVLDSLLDFFGM